jgi:hypothetical protein
MHGTACAVITGGAGVGVGVGVPHTCAVNRTTHHGSVTNNFVRVQQYLKPLWIYVPDVSPIPPGALRIAAANPAALYLCSSVHRELFKAALNLF